MKRKITRLARAGKCGDGLRFAAVPPASRGPYGGVWARPTLSWRSDASASAPKPAEVRWSRSRREGMGRRSFINARSVDVNELVSGKEHATKARPRRLTVARGN